MLIYESAGMGRGEIQENRRSIPIMLATVDKLDQKGKSVYFCGSGGNTKEMIKGNWLKIYQGLLAPVESVEWYQVQKGNSEMLVTQVKLYRLILNFMPVVHSFLWVNYYDLSYLLRRLYLKHAIDKISGKHVLHFGGKYDSYLLVPEILTKEK
jgi:hypothetical protein